MVLRLMRLGLEFTIQLCKILLKIILDHSLQSPAPPGRNGKKDEPTVAIAVAVAVPGAVAAPIGTGNKEEEATIGNVIEEQRMLEEQVNNCWNDVETSIQQGVESVDWEEVGDSIKVGVESVNWDEVGRALEDWCKSVDWDQVGKSISEAFEEQPSENKPGNDLTKK